MSNNEIEQLRAEICQLRGDLQKVEEARDFEEKFKSIFAEQRDTAEARAQSAESDLKAEREEVKICREMWGKETSKAETAEASLAKMLEAAKEVIEKSTNPFGREDSASVFVDRNAFNALRCLLEWLTKGPAS